MRSNPSVETPKESFMRWMATRLTIAPPDPQFLADVIRLVSNACEDILEGHDDAMHTDQLESARRLLNCYDDAVEKEGGPI